MTHKRVLSVILVLVLLAGCLPSVVFAVPQAQGAEVTPWTGDGDWLSAGTKVDNTKSYTITSEAYLPVIATCTVPDTWADTFTHVIGNGAVDHYINFSVQSYCNGSGNYQIYTTAQVWNGTTKSWNPSNRIEKWSDSFAEPISNVRLEITHDADTGSYGWKVYNCADDRLLCAQTLDAVYPTEELENCSECYLSCWRSSTGVTLSNTEVSYTAEDASTGAGNWTVNGTWTETDGVYENTVVNRDRLVCNDNLSNSSFRLALTLQHAQGNQTVMHFAATNGSEFFIRVVPNGDSTRYAMQYFTGTDWAPGVVSEFNASGNSDTVRLVFAYDKTANQFTIQICSADGTVLAEDTVTEERFSGLRDFFAGSSVTFSVGDGDQSVCKVSNTEVAIQTATETPDQPGPDISGGVGNWNATGTWTESNGVYEQPEVNRDRLLCLDNLGGKSFDLAFTVAFVGSNRVVAHFAGRDNTELFIRMTPQGNDVIFSMQYFTGSDWAPGVVSDMRASGVNGTMRVAFCYNPYLGELEIYLMDQNGSTVASDTVTESQCPELRNLFNSEIVQFSLGDGDESVCKIYDTTVYASSWYAETVSWERQEDTYFHTAEDAGRLVYSKDLCKRNFKIAFDLRILSEGQTENTACLGFSGAAEKSIFIRTALRNGNLVYTAQYYNGADWAEGVLASCDLPYAGSTVRHELSYDQTTTVLTLTLYGENGAVLWSDTVDRQDMNEIVFFFAKSVYFHIGGGDNHMFAVSNLTAESNQPTFVLPEMDTKVSEAVDWTLSNKVAAEQSPVGLLLEPVGLDGEAATLINKLTGDFELSCELGYEHSSDIVDSVRFTLRDETSDRKFLMRVKQCNTDILIEGQSLVDGEWKELINYGWIKNVGRNVSVLISHVAGSDTLLFRVKSGEQILYTYVLRDESLAEDNFFQSPGGLTFSIGCDEGVARISNIRIPGVEEGSDNSYAPDTSNTDASNKYSGRWVSIDGADAANGAGITYSDSPFSACFHTFKGTEVCYVGRTGPWGGKALIYLDGTLVKTADLYSEEVVDDVKLFEVNGLADDIHTLHITVSDEKNEKSSGYYVTIRGFEGEGALDYSTYLSQQYAAELESMSNGEKTGSDPVTWTRVENTASAPYTGVTVNGGLFGQSLDELEAYLDHCMASETYADGVGWTEWLPASNDGRMLAGAANYLRWRDKEEYEELIDEILTKLCNQVREDGYSNYYSEESSYQVTGENGNSERKNYDRVYWTRGMLAAAMYGDERAYTLLRGMYDWFNNCEYLDTLYDCMNCTNAFPGGPLMYNSAIGKVEDLLVNMKYLDLDFYYDAMIREDALAMAAFPGNRPHSYILLLVETAVEEYRATGIQRYYDAAVGGLNLYQKYYENVTGSAAICEEYSFAYPPSSYLLSKHTGEVCGTDHAINICSKLLQMDPDNVAYADEIERGIYNVIFSSQDSGGIRYHNPVQGIKDSVGCINSCCEVATTELLSRLPELIYSINENELYVNLFAGSTIVCQQGGKSFTLEMVTNYPYEENVKLLVKEADHVASSIHIRIPSWVADSVAICVNGAVVATGTPGTYSELSREWNAGDEITFSVPMELSLIKYEGVDQVRGAQRFAIKYGPIVLAVAGEGSLNNIPQITIDPNMPLEDQLVRKDGTLEFTLIGASEYRILSYAEVPDDTWFTVFPVVNFSAEPEDQKNPGDFGWETDAVEGKKDYSGWVATDGITLSADFDKTVENHRVWKDLVTNPDHFKITMNVIVSQETSAYVKIFGNTIEIDGNGGNGDEFIAKLNGQVQSLDGKDWQTAKGGLVTLTMERVNGGELKITLLGQDGEKLMALTAPIAEDYGALELGLYRGFARYEAITVTNFKPDADTGENPGDDDNSDAPTTGDRMLLPAMLLMTLSLTAGVAVLTRKKHTV